jgi:hypothetical protein
MTPAAARTAPAAAAALATAAAPAAPCRRRARGRPSEAEVARLLAEFHARGGRATACAPAHVLPIQNGAGRDAARWTT